MGIIHLDDVTAYRDQADDHDHFDTDAVFAEIDLERLKKFQSQQNSEYSTGTAVEGVVRVL